MNTNKTEDVDEQIPPARNDREMNKIPDLNVGDTVRVVTKGNYAPDRTLTVVAEGTDSYPQVLFADLGIVDGGYVLEGYGTTYHLTTTESIMGAWRRVNIVFPSRPEGQTVSDIEIVERGDSSSDKSSNQN